MNTPNGKPFCTLTFAHRDSNDFSAYNDAVQWLRSRGFSVGSMERGAPTAAFLDTSEVSKWRNLLPAERAVVDAKILPGSNGTFREQAVTVELYVDMDALIGTAIGKAMVPSIIHGTPSDVKPLGVFASSISEAISR